MGLDAVLAALRAADQHPNRMSAPPAEAAAAAAAANAAFASAAAAATLRSSAASAAAAATLRSSAAPASGTACAASIDASAGLVARHFDQDARRGQDGVCRQPADCPARDVLPLRCRLGSGRAGAHETHHGALSRDPTRTPGGRARRRRGRERRRRASAAHAR
eukprot:7391507-Prymnesium_polylepis.1